MTNTNMPAPEPKAPKRKKRRWTKVVLIILVLILLLVALTPTLLSTDAGKNFLLGKINTRLRGKLSADSISVGWFSGMSMRNVTLVDPEGKPVVHVAKLDTGISLMNLVTSKTLSVNIDVQADGHLVSYADGTSNLSRSLPAPTGKTESAGEPYVVRGPVKVELTSFVFESPDAPALTVDSAKVGGNVDTGGGNSMLDAELAAHNGNNAPASFSTHLDGPFFEHGALRPMEQMTGKADATMKSLNLAAMSPFLQMAGMHVNISGEANGEVHLADQKLTGNVVVADAKLPIGEDMPTFKKTTVTINAAVGGGKVDVQDTRLVGDDFDLGVNGSFATKGLGGKLPPLTLKGTVNGVGLKQKMPKTLAKLPDTQADVDLTVGLDVSGKTCMFTAESRVAEKDPKTGAGNAIVFAPNSMLNWGGGNSDATFTLNYDAVRLGQILGAYLPEGTVLQGKGEKKFHVSGVLDMSAAGTKKFGALNVEGEVALDRASVPSWGVEVTNAVVPIAMKDGVMPLKGGQMGLNQGSVTLRGRVDFKQHDVPTYIFDEQPQAAPLASNVQINKVFANEFLSFLPLNWGEQGKSAALAEVTGQMNLSIQQAEVVLSSEGLKTSTAKMVMGINNLSTDAPFFSQVLSALGPVAKITQTGASFRNANMPNVPVNLAKGRVSYQNLTLGTTSNALVFSGDVGLDKTLNMNLTYQDKRLNVPVPIGLKGTTTKPELAVSAQNVGNTIQNVAPGVIDDLLNRKKK